MDSILIALVLLGVALVLALWQWRSKKLWRNQKPMDSHLSLNSQEERKRQDYLQPHRPNSTRDTDLHTTEYQGIKVTDYRGTNTRRPVSTWKRHNNMPESVQFTLGIASLATMLIGPFLADYLGFGKGTSALVMLVGFISLLIFIFLPSAEKQPEREELKRQEETSAAKDEQRGEQGSAQSSSALTGIRRVVSGVICIECPSCGTDFNRALVLQEIRKQSPFVFEFQHWSTGFVCQVCRARITISKSADD